jgi:hypothetical protein
MSTGSQQAHTDTCRQSELKLVALIDFTIRGGSKIDLTYHASMLPLLIATAALVTHGNRASSRFYDDPAFHAYEGRAHGAPDSGADAGAGRVKPLPRDTDGLSS